MKDYPGFIVLIKTNFDKFIGIFVDSKYESTEGMINVEDGKTLIGKQANNAMVFYLL